MLGLFALLFGELSDSFDGESFGEDGVLDGVSLDAIGDPATSVRGDDTVLLGLLWTDKPGLIGDFDLTGVSGLFGKGETGV